MKTLRDHVDDYLTIRRVLGFKLRYEGLSLPQLVDYLEAAGATTVTRDLAVSWAQLNAAAHSRHWAKRLVIARRFAAYLQTIDPSTEVPPENVFAVRYQRPTPYLWSDEDVSRLLEAAQRMRPALKAATYSTLFGLLAATGMRVGEAITLDRQDVDLDAGLITIHAHTTKHDRARLVPLHPTATDALKRYAATRELLSPRPGSRAFLLTSIGMRVHPTSVCQIMRRLTTELGLRTATVHPRTHDLRHTFAVNTLLEHQRSGAPVDGRIADLSTYLGHVNPANTYWYLTATPELMQAAADRLDARFGDLS